MIDAESGSGQRPSTRSSGSSLEDALTYTCRLHAGQTRKDKQETPYIAHLLGVCSLVLEAGGDDEQAVAALLHDAVEDQGGNETLEEIRERFGDRVARIVAGCTDSYEQPKPPWRPRKESYLRGLAEKPADVLLVVGADKLYNVRSIVRDHRIHGAEVFERFTPEPEGTAWYYRTLAEKLRASELDSWLADELERAVAELEKRVRAAS